MQSWRETLRYAVSVPERAVRAVFAGAGGVVVETAELVLPRLVRRSRLYEATAHNALRIAVELVGDVERDASKVAAGEASAGRVAMKKAFGNVVEVGSVAAFGFSPLWLLAAASDVMGGTRTYLQALEDELKAAGFLDADADFDSLDALLRTFEQTTGASARLIDLPPIEVAELRTALNEFRRAPDALPSPEELAGLADGLQRLARAEQRSMLEVASGVGLAFVTSAQKVGHRDVVLPYREDWQPLRSEGFAAYGTRVARPYARAMAGHFRPERRTLTERVPEFAGQAVRWVRSRTRWGSDRGK